MHSDAKSRPVELSKVGVGGAGCRAYAGNDCCIGGEPIDGIPLDQESGMRPAYPSMVASVGYSRCFRRLRHHIRRPIIQIIRLKV